MRDDHRAAGFWWFAWVAGLTAMIVLGVWFARVESAAMANTYPDKDGYYTWIAPFANVAEVQANWQTVGAPCYSVPKPGKLRMVCQSAGLVTRQTWSRQFAITVTAQVSASAISGGRYFAGLTIYDAASGDTQYGELALAYKVPPFQTVNMKAAGALVNDSLWWWNGPVAVGWHTLQVVYLPVGQYRFYLDGALAATVTPWQPLKRDPAVFLVCASVGEATPDDGSLAACEFGPVTVQGVPSAAVRATYLPQAHDRGTAGTQGYP